MARWHESSCSDPNVFISLDTSLPACKSCGRSFSLQWLRPEHQPPRDTEKPPPDEPLGQLNLSWPSTVPYRTFDFDAEVYNKLGISLSAAGMNEGRAGKRTGEPRNDEPLHGDSLSSSIYGKRLGNNEFRLACLGPPSSKDVESASDISPDLVHIDLETYTQTHCPEYETTSYTWGGEDGDSELTEPLFFGPYWDILFQTKNCWAMIRKLRPQRGLRLVWVDAICINQSDDVERANQVAKMGQIYEGAWRVVVFLGSDLQKMAQTTPAITGPAIRTIARAMEPKSDHAWPFPEENIQRMPLARDTNYLDSERDSITESVARSQFSTERPPPRQRQLNDGLGTDFQRLSIASAAFPPVHHPMRRKLHELPYNRGSNLDSKRDFSGGNISFKDITKRRYFSRVWVVQELVISRQALFLIGDEEYVADHLTAQELERRKEWRWDKFRVPWLQYMTQRRLPGVNRNDLLGMFDLMTGMESSDPRDRVFGMLGLLERGHEIQPNYFISEKHVRLGFFAHCITKAKNLDVLLNASGTRAWDTPWPSWAPDHGTSHRFTDIQGHVGLETDLHRYVRHWYWKESSSREWLAWPIGNPDNVTGVSIIRFLDFFLLIHDRMLQLTPADGTTISLLIV